MFCCNPISSLLNIPAAYHTSVIHAIFAILKTYILARVYWFVISLIYNKVWGYYTQSKYLKIAQKKKQITDATNLLQYNKCKQNYQKITQVKEEELLKANITLLHKWMIEGKLTPTQLHDFYTLRCYEIGCRLNLVAELIYDFSRPLAISSDEILAKNVNSGAWKSTEDMPRLFGIPISIKDVYDIAGFDTSLGTATQVFKPCEKTGLIVNMIIEAGGVPFVKSTVPQLLLINETNNFIWGRGMNPWNIKRSCGGSSGGEGGLVSAGCSPLGLGSDGGGSVRIPSLYCGLYGFKPTGNRFTMIGHKKPSEYTPRHIGSALGPLAKNTEDCERMAEILMNGDMVSKEEVLRKTLPWDYNKYTPVEDKIKNRKLRIGYIRGFKVRF